MRVPSISDQVDLALLAALFCMLLLYTAYSGDARTDAAPQQFPKTTASAESLAFTISTEAVVFG